MTQKFLDLAGLVALWAKIKALISSINIGNGKFLFKIQPNPGQNITKLVTEFTANLEDSDTSTVTAVGGTNISISSPTPSDGTFTIAHATPSGASALSTAVLKKLLWDSQGHIVGSANVSASDLGINDGTFTVKSKSGSTVTNVADFTANQSGTDDVTFIQGNNITLTPNATNRTITIDAVATAPNDGPLYVKGDTGRQQAFSADNANDLDLTIKGDTNFIETAISTLTDETIVTVSHKTPTGGSTFTLDTATASGYTSGSNILSELSIKTNNGHITQITPTYKKIGLVTSVSAGLMSASDKAALDGMLLAIATALTSAITPKGSISALDLVTAIQSQNNTILSSAHLGDLYQLSSPLVIGTTQSGDVSTYYGNFVEGDSLTRSGLERHEIPAGLYIMVVNTGTLLLPTYKLDIVSGLYDNQFLNRAIPVDTSDPDYDGPDTTEDPTIDSICV